MLDRAVYKREITEAGRAQILEDDSFALELVDLADRDIVIGALTEQEDVKLAMHAAVDKIVDSPDVISTFNTSFIPMMKLGGVTSSAGEGGYTPFPACDSNGSDYNGPGDADNLADSAAAGAGFEGCARYGGYPDEAEIRVCYERSFGAIFAGCDHHS